MEWNAPSLFSSNKHSVFVLSHFVSFFPFIFIFSFIFFPTLYAFFFSSFFSILYFQFFLCTRMGKELYIQHGAKMSLHRHTTISSNIQAHLLLYMTQCVCIYKKRQKITHFFSKSKKKERRKNEKRKGTANIQYDNISF